MKNEITPKDKYYGNVFALESRIFGEYLKHYNELDEVPICSFPRVYITGFPFDEGAFHNGGRVGSEKAPKNIRHILDTYNIYPGDSFGQNIEIIDLGDLNKVKSEIEDQEEEN